LIIPSPADDDARWMTTPRATRSVGGSVIPEECGH
jgi:hypothetical protein